MTAGSQLRKEKCPRVFWLFTPTTLRASTVGTPSGMLWKDAVSQPSCCFTSLATQSTKSNCGFLSRVIVTAESNIQLLNTQTGLSRRLINLQLPSPVNGSLTYFAGCIPNASDSLTKVLTRLRTFVELGKQARPQREWLTKSAKSRSRP
jgi:hypothetical protein